MRSRSSVFRSPGSVTSQLTLRDLRLDDKAGRIQVAVSFVLEWWTTQLTGAQLILAPCSFTLRNRSLTPSQFSLLFWSKLLLQVWKWHRETFPFISVEHTRVCSTVFFSGSHFCTVQHDIKPPGSLLTMQANLFPHLSRPHSPPFLLFLYAPCEFIF